MGDKTDRECNRKNLKEKSNRKSLLKRQGGDAENQGNYKMQSMDTKNVTPN